MDSAYLDGYGGLLLMFILAAGLAGVLVVASTVVGKHKHSKEKDQAYECGMAPIGDARQPPADKRPAAAPAEPRAPTAPDQNQPRPPKSLIDEYA